METEAGAEQPLYVDGQAPLSSVLCRQPDGEGVTHGMEGFKGHRGKILDPTVLLLIWMVHGFS